MSDIKDEVEIEIDEPIIEKKSDEPELQIEKVEDEPRQVTAKAPIEPDDGINDLKSKLVEEQRLRFEAENRAREAIQRQYRAQSETEDANLTLVESAIKTLTDEGEAIKHYYKEAMAIGDYDKVAELQEAMATNKVRMSELQKGRDYMRNRAEAARQEAEAAKAGPQGADPVEALASRLSPRSAEWVRRNPQYATNPKLFQKMSAAHQMVVADGIEPDTDEYFEAVEDALKIRRQPERAPERSEEPDATSEAAKPVQRRAAPPAAPVSRSSGGPGAPRPNVVRLTRAEAEAARDMGMTEQEYARNKLLLQKEGRI